MEERIMSAPQEVWEMATKYEYTDAYKETQRRPLYPVPDHIRLNGVMSDKLHDIGQSCKPIHQRDAAVPVFSVEIMEEDITDDSAKLWDFLTPKYNGLGLEELSVYGITLLFSSNDGQIACDIGFHYSDRVGGGFNEIGTVCIMADGDYFFTFPHYMDLTAYEDFALYDYDSITKFCNWLGYFWRGIQHEFIYRPEIIHVQHHRNTAAEKKCLEKMYPQKHHITKVQRVITILLDEDDEAEIIHTGRHTISLSLWSVSGHWREMKSGKRVWIAPYYKGKGRAKQDVEFCAKEYRFVKEAEDNA